MSNITASQARAELARRGRNELGHPTHNKSNSKAKRNQSVQNGTFGLSNSDLVALATKPEGVWVPTAAELALLTQVIEPTPDANMGSICLANSSARTRMALANV